MENNLAQPAKRQRDYFILVLACFLAYANSLSGDFVFDDILQIVDNQAIRNLSNLSTAFSKSLWSFQQADAEGYSLPYYRPIFTIYLTIGYQLFGLWPQGWHLMNLAIHSGATVLVYSLFIRLLPESQRLALVGALLFALIPIHVESISWISGVPDALATLFLIPSIIFYVRWREEAKWPLLGLALGLFLFSLFCKEIPILIPLVLIVWEMTRSTATNFTAKLFSSIKPVLPFAIPGAVYLIIRVAVLGKLFWAHPISTQTSDSLINGTVPSILTYYLKNLIFPFNLSLIYKTRFIESFFDIAFWLPLSILIATAIALFIFRKKIAGPIWVACALMLVPLIPVLNLSVFHYKYILQDRYLYIPSIGFVLLIAILIEKLWTSEKLALRKIAPIVAVILCLAYLAGTIMQNRVWQSATTLWERSASIEPDWWAIRYNLGLALDLEKKHSEAVREFDVALELPSFDRKDALIYNNRALAKRSLGDLDSAVKDFGKALEIEPGMVQAITNLGIVTFERQNYPEAEKLFQKADKIKPGDPIIEFNIARTWAAISRHKEALVIYERLLKTGTGDAALLFYTAVSLRRVGQPERAISLLSEAERFSQDEVLKKMIAEEKNGTK